MTFAKVKTWFQAHSPFSCSSSHFTVIPFLPCLLFIHMWKWRSHAHYTHYCLKTFSPKSYGLQRNWTFIPKNTVKASRMKRENLFYKLWPQHSFVVNVTPRKSDYFICHHLRSCLCSFSSFIYYSFINGCRWSFDFHLLLSKSQGWYVSIFISSI